MEDRLKAAEEYIDKCKWMYQRHLQEAIEANDEKGAKIIKSQYDRYFRLRVAISNDLILADRLIYEATYRNNISTSSIGPCWERYLLEVYEEE